MNKLLTFVLLFVLSLISVSMADEINVEPGENSLQIALDNANPGDVLILENNGVYPNQGKISVNVPVTIKAADGSTRTDYAIVTQIAKADGQYDPAAVEVSADVTFQGIYFVGSQGSRVAANGRAIRFHASNLDVHIDNCIFEQYWLRTIDYNDQDSIKLTLTNNIHLWDGRDDRLDNGRVVDFRNATYVDTLIMENCTFLNCNDRFIRHMNPNGKPLKYVRINHCTFYGNYGYRPPFQFRNAEELVIINNIFANIGLLGADYSVQGKANRNNEIDYSDPDAICIFTVTGTDSVNTKITMHNNNVFNEQRFDDVFALNPDSCYKMPIFNQMFKDKIDENIAMMREELSFNRAPSLDSVLTTVETYVKGETNFSRVGLLSHFEVVLPGELDMNYGVTAASYTGAEGGFPLGDLNWYTDKKAEWLATAIDNDDKHMMPDAFSLFQNYPNPFNPETNIHFVLNKPGVVKIEVYNLIGQKISTLLNEKLVSGPHDVIWNGTDGLGRSVPSGIYFYKLQVGQKSDIKKMILIK